MLRGDEIIVKVTIYTLRIDPAFLSVSLLIFIRLQDKDNLKQKRPLANTGRRESILNRLFLFLFCTLIIFRR